MNRLFENLNPAQLKDIEHIKEPLLIQARTKYSITCDKDLLTLGEYQKIQIVNPSQFWGKYKDDGKDLWKQRTKFITQK